LFHLVSPFLIGQSRLSMSKSRSLAGHASQSCVSAILSTFTGVTRHVAAASFKWVNPMTNHQLIVAAILVFCAGLLGQDSHKKSLLVNGRVVPSGVLQTQGQLYVDVQDLAHILGASVSLQGDSVTMTLPSANATSDPQAPVGHLSADFQRTAITALSEMREYKGVMEGVVQSGTPVGGHWIQKYETQAQAAMAQTAAAASSESDHRTLALLQNGWGQLQSWAHRIVAERKAMNATRSMSENALANDPALAKLTECGGALSQVVTSGTFSEPASCR